MALLLPNHNAIFLHVPKTGGLFLQNYLRQSKIPHRMIGYRHSPADLIGLHAFQGCFKFCFIRRPDTWYKSYWQMRIREVGGKGGHLGIGNDKGGPHPLFHPTWEIDPYCMHENLNQFILNCAELDGYLVRTYKRFIGHGRYKVDFVGNHETLIPDLIIVFRHIGLRFNEAHLRNAPLYNPSIQVQEILPNIRTKILKVEKEYENIKTGFQ